jgi:GNAT superfamily N-acetyltransferase
MTGRDGLLYREDYFADPSGWQAIKDLLLDIFDVDIAPLDALGGPDPTSMPSAYFDADGRCVANFTAFAMPLVFNTRLVKATGLQSGAVRPEYRGRGVFRDLIRRTLQRCDAAGFEAAVLYTDKPGLYTPHGFSVVPQYRFSGPPPERPAMPSAHSTRRLAPLADVGALRHLLAQRTPVSNRFAVVGQVEMFLLNMSFAEDIQVDLMPDGSAAIAWRQDADGTFELLDIAGLRIPRMAEILHALDVTPPRVTCFFPPDRLDWRGDALEDKGELVFMMRCAPELLPNTPTCLSPMAEF